MRTSLGDFPRTFVTKSRQVLRLQILKENQHQSLAEAYLAFQPHHSCHGLPPTDNESRRKWVEETIGRSINLLAVCPHSGIVGHTALLPLDGRQCEMLVAVWPPFQNMGIGSELMRGCVNMACELGFEQMWLRLETADLHARHIATKCGFKPWKRWSRDSKMVCDLRRHRADKSALQVENAAIPTSHLHLNFDSVPMSEQTMS